MEKRSNPSTKTCSSKSLNDIPTGAIWPQLGVQETLKYADDITLVTRARDVYGYGNQNYRTAWQHPHKKVSIQRYEWRSDQRYQSWS
jgi:hypothetical protein